MLGKLVDLDPDVVHGALDLRFHSSIEAAARSSFAMRTS
jgi:hypothetical protein